MPGNPVHLNGDSKSVSVVALEIISCLKTHVISSVHHGVYEKVSGMAF